jgi:hypothetical protein
MTVVDASLALVGKRISYPATHKHNYMSSMLVCTTFTYSRLYVTLNMISFTDSIIGQELRSLNWLQTPFPRQLIQANPLPATEREEKIGQRKASDKFHRQQKMCSSLRVLSP